MEEHPIKCVVEPIAEQKSAVPCCELQLPYAGFYTRLQVLNSDNVKATPNHVAVADS